MRPTPLVPPPPSGRPGGCCGCLLFPGIFALFGSSAFWFFGFTAGLLLHAAAALVWAGTQAIGHALFGWPLPRLHVPERPRRQELE